MTQLQQCSSGSYRGWGNIGGGGGGGGQEAIERYSPKKKTGKTVKGKGVLHIALY